MATSRLLLKPLRPMGCGLTTLLQCARRDWVSVAEACRKLLTSVVMLRSRILTV